MPNSPKGRQDDALVQLFRAELEAHAGVLSAWARAGATLEGNQVASAVDRAAHSIKGAARIVDEQAVASMADALEQCLRTWHALPAGLSTRAAELVLGTCGLLQRLARAKELPAEFAASHIAELQATRQALETLAVAHELGPDDVAPASPHKSTPPGQADTVMLELFRVELEQCTATLSDGLLALDAGDPPAAAWELFMRAAHSIKGATRIVHLDAMARLAHLLEDCLLAARSKRLTLAPDDVDLLLQAVDSMRSAGRVLAERVPAGRAQVETAAAVAAERLALLLERTASPAPTAPTAPSAPTVPTAPTAQTAPIASSRPSQARRGQAPPQTEPLLGAPKLSIPSVVFNRDAVIEFPTLSRAPRARVSAPAPAHILSRPSQDAARAPGLKAPRDASPPSEELRVGSGQRTPDRVLRVAIDSVERLLGLAGESLVQSRRVAGFARDLQRVRRQHASMLESIAGLERQLGGAEHAGARELLTETKLRARECSALLGHHGGELDQYIRRAEELGEQLYREALKSRMRPFADGMGGLPRLARDLARQLGKRVRLEIIGEATEVDRDALDGLEGPLNHLLRNAIDHGIETPEQRVSCGKPEIGVIRIEARHHAGMLSIAVSDDGRGLDTGSILAQVLRRGLATPHNASKLSPAELFEFLFLPGFSTAAAVSEISGRGVGLDVVKNAIEALGGSVRATAEPSRGSAFHLLLPVTRSVLRAVVAEVAGDFYAFPLLRIDRIDRVPLAEVQHLESSPYVRFDGRPVALLSARDLLGVTEPAQPEPLLNVIVVSDRTKRFGITVDALRGEHDLVVRPLDARLGKVQDIAAAAVLDDGTPALIIDVDDVLRSIERRVQGKTITTLHGEAREAKAPHKRVLVVDDSIMVREAERQLLLNRGFEVDVAVDGMDGLNAVRRTRYDLVITDVDMPRMNGIELVRSIKQDALLQAIPVVIVSYKDREEDRMRGLEAGANYYLSKSSFHDDKLVEAVEDLIGAAT